VRGHRDPKGIKGVGTSASLSAGKATYRQQQAEGGMLPVNECM